MIADLPVFDLGSGMVAGLPSAAARQDMIRFGIASLATGGFQYRGSRYCDLDEALLRARREACRGF